MLAGLLLVPAVAAATDPDATEIEHAAARPGWLSRTFQRYFGGDAPPGAELGGRSFEIVDRYSQHAGQLIEVVLISQVGKFEAGWSGDHGVARRVLDSATKPFQTYTRDRTIRQYLLFQAGDVVDPFRIADTERLLRGLDYIEDVRITVVPLQGGGGTVAIVVESRDRWPFGASAVLKDVGRYEASLFSSNVGGVGLRFDNRLIYREDREPNVGYRGSLRQRNFRGTFVAAELAFEDSYSRHHVGGALTRELEHPAIKWVGGTAWSRTRERDAGPDPDEHEISDIWLGDVIRLQAGTGKGGTARPLLVPAVRLSHRVYLDRPAVGRDTLRRFHNNTNYLGGVTYQRFKYYKTSYLFDMGETEDLPAGLVLKLSGGYQDGEFHGRSQGFFQSSYFATRNRGDVAFARLDIGGFMRNRRYEDGSLIAAGGYFSPLLDWGRWHSRLYTFLTYHRAINGDSRGALRLGDATGVRGMDNDLVFGDQRLVGNLELRVFPPWELWGFRFMVLGFLDAGTIVDERDPLLQNKFYGSTGLAVRIQNPDLVVPPLQLRVAFRNSIDDKGVLVSLRIGGPDSPRWIIPDTKPGGFEFR